MVEVAFVVVVRTKVESVAVEVAVITPEVRLPTEVDAVVKMVPVAEVKERRGAET